MDNVLTLNLTHFFCLFNQKCLFVFCVCIPVCIPLYFSVRPERFYSVWNSLFFRCTQFDFSIIFNFQLWFLGAFFEPFCSQGSLSSPAHTLAPGTGTLAHKGWPMVGSRLGSRLDLMPPGCLVCGGIRERVCRTPTLTLNLNLASLETQPVGVGGISLIHPVKTILLLSTAQPPPLWPQVVVPRAGEGSAVPARPARSPGGLTAKAAECILRFGIFFCSPPEFPTDLYFRSQKLPQGSHG